jgi:putative ubiquitin-RnfH superfamily antitoxin RatB of RatAB toxin-antitoxin module
MGEVQAVRVTVSYSPAPRRVLEWAVSVGAGGVVLDALQASPLPREAPELDLGQAAVGIWGRKAGLQERLRDGDRVEVLRPLQVDPKIARRERFRKQGSRAAGLFSRKRRDSAPDGKIAFG